MKLLAERMQTDRYLDPDGRVVFTERFLVRQGHCCGNGCRHCPYEPKHRPGAVRWRATLEKYRNRL